MDYKKLYLEQKIQSMTMEIQVLHLRFQILQPELTQAQAELKAYNEKLEAEKTRNMKSEDIKKKKQGYTKMADVKITGLPELFTTAGEDLLATVDNPSGVPVTRKITRTNFLSGIVSDTEYGIDWNGVTDAAPSKKVVYDKIEKMDTGNVTGPVTHLASYVPQWNAVPNSKTLIEGFQITDAGKALLDDADAAAQRTTLGALPGNHDAVVKAWIHFNGTGTIAIDDSFNVTSIIDDGTGMYSIYWDTDFANANYCVVGFCGVNGEGENTLVQGMAAGSIQILTDTPAGDVANSSIVCVIAIGEQQGEINESKNNL